MDDRPLRFAVGVPRRRQSRASHLLGAPEIALVDTASPTKRRSGTSSEEPAGYAVGWAPSHSRKQGESVNKYDAARVLVVGMVAGFLTFVATR